MTNDPKKIQQLATAFGIASQLYATRMNQLLGSHDLTIAQFGLLNHLLRSGSQAHTISELTSALEINQPGVTKIIKKFEQLGWVSVQTNATDSRKREVYITQTGAQTVQQIILAMGPDIMAWFADWGEAELTQFTQSLQKLAAWLDENRIDTP